MSGSRPEEKPPALCTAWISTLALTTRSTRRSAKAADFHESTTVEIVWTVIPFLIVIGMALPATKAVVAQKDTTNADLTIKATGYQWKWGYDYLKGEGEGIGFVSTLDSDQRAMSDAGGPKKGESVDNYLLKVDFPLVVPVDKKIRIITTANDVIHAWMVPAFAVKQDAIPGFVRDTWFKVEPGHEGDYYGQCAELCGKEHAYMPIHVKVVSDAEYTTWVAGEKKKLAALADDPAKEWKLPDLIARGEKVYASNCAACHQANGKGAGPIKPLDGSPTVLDADRGVAFQQEKNPAPKVKADIAVGAAKRPVITRWLDGDRSLPVATVKRSATTWITPSAS
mgnify:CR=1 FL=1